MSNLASTFNELLEQRGAPPSKGSFNVDNINNFLKEAYRISTLITTLHRDLLSLRQAYLSTAAPRKTHLHVRNPSSSTPQYLTDRDREEIDANAKATLRELNATIRALSEAETLRRDMVAALLKKKYSSRFGAWAAGGLGGEKRRSPEQIAEEDAARQTEAHREAVLWFLRQRLGAVAELQTGMMETRLTREMEKNRSVLAKARGGMGIGVSDLPVPGVSAAERRMSLSGKGRGTAGLPVGDEEEARRRPPQDDLTEEQRQMFEKGNQDMLKHYESTLDKVRTAETSLVEISELHTLLHNNIETQAEHINQLVEDALSTVENVGSGNKELKKATQRSSPARYTFFAATGLCVFLVVWDLLI